MIKMSDTAEIDYISKIDFSNGFQRFHVKWPLKDLTSTKRKYSTSFETTVIDGGGVITLSWSLIVDKSSKNPTYTWFGAKLMATSRKITPLISRICLSSSTNVVFDSSYFVVVPDGNDGYGHHVPSSEIDAYPNYDLMLHYWMDIPHAVAIDDNSDNLGEARGQNSIKKACNDVFLSDASKMFSRVVKADSDPSSDFAVIMVNSKDEPLRQFHCHTIFLCNRSDVFEKMLASDKWKENSVQDGRSVKIKDVNSQVMETVLCYIYTSTLPDPSIDHDHLCGIIFAADKYNLKELKNWSAGILIHKYNSIDDRIEQLILADRHNLAQLKAVCIDQLSLNFSKLCLDFAAVTDIPDSLRLEVVKAVSDRQLKTNNITLSAA